MKLELVPVIAVLALAMPLVNGQCVTLITSFQFEDGDFFPNPNVIDYDLESELFLGPGLGAIAEVHVNYSSTVANGGAMVTIEYQTSDTGNARFTYDNETAACQRPNADVICDLGTLGILQDPSSSSKRVSPAFALAAIALYAQDLSSLAVAGVFLAPQFVAAQTCTERLVITLTLPDIESTVSVTPSVLTDSIKFQAQCVGARVSCNRNILTGCRFCD